MPSITSRMEQQGAGAVSSAQRAGMQHPTWPRSCSGQGAAAGGSGAFLALIPPGSLGSGRRAAPWSAGNAEHPREHGDGGASDQGQGWSCSSDAGGGRRKEVKALLVVDVGL